VVASIDNTTSQQHNIAVAPLSPLDSSARGLRRGVGSREQQTQNEGRETRGSEPEEDLIDISWCGVDSLVVAYPVARCTWQKWPVAVCHLRQPYIANIAHHPSSATRHDSRYTRAYMYLYNHHHLTRRTPRRTSGIRYIRPASCPLHVPTLPVAASGQLPAASGQPARRTHGLGSSPLMSRCHPFTSP
jgi:hypothetical protein